MPFQHQGLPVFPRRLGINLCPVADCARQLYHQQMAHLGSLVQAAVAGMKLGAWLCSCRWEENGRSSRSASQSCMLKRQQTGLQKRTFLLPALSLLYLTVPNMSKQGWALLLLLIPTAKAWVFLICLKGSKFLLVISWLPLHIISTSVHQRLEGRSQGLLWGCRSSSRWEQILQACREFL